MRHTLNTENYLGDSYVPNNDGTAQISVTRSVCLFH
jgi:hypothetical protein